MEEFRKIPGYEDSVYLASSENGIFNGSSYLKPYNRAVTLRYKGKSINEFVDDLVARAFLEKTDERPYLYHLDNDWNNNKLSNLKYVNNSDILEPEEDGWKYIPDLDNLYMAHPDGKIRSVNHFTDEVCRGKQLYKYYKGKILKGVRGSDGYTHVMISKEGKSRYISVHRLVALTFLPNPDNLPQVNHIDGNKENNSIDNLEWCSRIHNMNHAKSLGLWDPKVCGQSSRLKNGKPVRCIEDGFEYLSISDCAKHYGMDFESVRESIETGRPRKGYTFQYI